MLQKGCGASGGSLKPQRRGGYFEVLHLCVRSPAKIGRIWPNSAQMGQARPRLAKIDQNRPPGSYGVRGCLLETRRTRATISVRVRVRVTARSGPVWSSAGRETQKTEFSGPAGRRKIPARPTSVLWLGCVSAALGPIPAAMLQRWIFGPAVASFLDTDGSPPPGPQSSHADQPSAGSVSYPRQWVPSPALL